MINSLERNKPLKIGLWLALTLSSFGLVIAFNLPGRVWQSLDALFRLDFSLDGMQNRPTPFDNFDSPFVLFPLLCLLVWLLACFGLFSLNKTRTKTPFTKITTQSWLFLTIGLLLILFIGFEVRASQLLPDAAGQTPAANYDEMVYFSAAGLLAGGQMPYRDFFLAHPPVALLPYSLLFKLTGGAVGGQAAFVAARWLTVIIGVLTIAGLGWAGSRLWQNFPSTNNQQPTTNNLTWSLPGLAAALLYALDGRAAQVAVLETVSNLFAIFALVVLLEGLQRENNRWWLMAAGILAGLAFLSKLPGLAVIFAFVVYLGWRQMWRGLGWVTGGFGAVTVVVMGLFGLLGGPGELLRQVLFFQVLRPQEVREGKDQIGTIADYPQTGLTIFLAGVAFVFIAWSLYRRRSNSDLWLIPALWSLPLVAVLIFGKSFHPWYYVQLALPLSLLAGTLFQFNRPPTPNPRPSAGRPSWWLKPALLVAIGLVSLPLLAREWQSSQTSNPERNYNVTADYLKSQPGTDPVLVFDPGYTFMAGRTPARLPNGKILVDSAGYMTYLNLEVDRTGLFNLTGQLFNFNRERGQVKAIFDRERAQAIVSSAIRPGMWVALDEKIGLPQLTPRSVEYIATTGTNAGRIGFTDIYRARSDQPALREYKFDNGLFLTPAGLSSSFQGKANYDPLRDDGTLSLPQKQVGTRTLDLRFTWRVSSPPPQQAKVFIHLISEQSGEKVAQRDILPLDGLGDTRNWQKGDYFQDVHSLPLPSTLAVGRYRVEIGLYDANNTQRINVEGKDSLVLGYVVVE